MSPSSREAEVYIVHEGKQAGPFSVAELKRQVASGNVARDTLVWFKGLGEWAPLKDVFSEEIEIEDTPRSRNSATGLALIRDDGLETPPELPDSLKGKWAGPRAGAGRLFIPEEPLEEEGISTPQWELQEAKRLKQERGGGGGNLIRIVLIAGLGVAIWLLLK